MFPVFLLNWALIQQLKMVGTLSLWLWLAFAWLENLMAVTGWTGRAALVHLIRKIHVSNNKLSAVKLISYCCISVKWWCRHLRICRASTILGLSLLQHLLIFLLMKMCVHLRQMMSWQGDSLKLVRPRLGIWSNSTVIMSWAYCIIYSIKDKFIPPTIQQLLWPQVNPLSADSPWSLPAIGYKRFLILQMGQYIENGPTHLYSHIIKRVNSSVSTI